MTSKALSTRSLFIEHIVKILNGQTLTTSQIYRRLRKISKVFTLGLVRTFLRRLEQKNLLDRGTRKREASWSNKPGWLPAMQSILAALATLGPAAATAF